MSLEEKHPDNRNQCPVNCENVDLIPECYHYSNRCFCFMCTCGQHKCPSLKKTFFVKGTFNSSYSRSFAKVSNAQVPIPRVYGQYIPNTHKLDTKTVYMSEYAARQPSVEKIQRSETPQPHYKFDASSQYSKDFPNWGPVDIIITKRPVNPIHETKLKFHGKSSYGEYFNVKNPKAHVNVNYRSREFKPKSFEVPLQTTFQRDYKASSPDNYPKHERKRSEKSPGIFYNKHQFTTTTATAYQHVASSLKDPMQYRKEILNKAK